MNQEQIINQMVESYNLYTGSNEGIIDAAHYIAAEFEKQTSLAEQLENALQSIVNHGEGDKRSMVFCAEKALREYRNNKNK